MAKNKSPYPLHRGGYIYSKGTAAGFQRMKRLGIPQPLFKLEDKLARELKRKFMEMAQTMLRDFKKACQDQHAHTADAAAPLTQDTMDDLLDFFDEMSKTMEQDPIAENTANKMQMAAVADQLEALWFDETGGAIQDEQLEATVEKTFEENQRDILRRLFTDCDTKTQRILVSMSLDKKQVFNANMENLRRLYLDNSIERLGWEQMAIKRAFLRRIRDYVEGKSRYMRYEDLTKLAYAKSDNITRMFARDQMARFNKALTLSTFLNAGVTKVKWITSHDVRVRPTHKALDGQVFDINNLPDEVDDYNCRCGLVPVEWAE